MCSHYFLDHPRISSMLKSILVDNVSEVFLGTQTHVGEFVTGNRVEIQRNWFDLSLSVMGKLLMMTFSGSYI